ncbi:hypothetical protein HZB07_03785 [Candidatus Saganbacteria bacterium]|nr:hypothetical protein [Candidatus Saganbacteria bacterium]
MTDEAVLKAIIAKLNKLQIPYALTGGLAVSFYGEPRSTHDFDLVIQIAAGGGIVKKLLANFAQDFYISEEGIIDALLHRTMFNIISHETSLKIDLWIMKEDEYNRTAFARRIKTSVLDLDLFILSAEDLILSKLQWYKASEVEKHLNDVKRIITIQKDKLDFVYLNNWVSKLAVGETLKNLI